jgi:hypothetical protein
VRPATDWLRREAPELRIVAPALWHAVERRRERAAATFPGVTAGGRRTGRPSGGDLLSPYLLSGLAACAACGGSLVAITRPHGTGGNRRRVKMSGASITRSAARWSARTTS